MSILAKIIAQKKLEIAALDARALRRAAESVPVPRDFLAEMKRRRNGRDPSLIAELKRASPSKGILAPQLDLFQVADIYAQNGASAISVLTDEKFFLGKLETLHDLRFKYQARLPLLRKDFIIDEVQLYETRANGADAVLLITAQRLARRLCEHCKEPEELPKEALLEEGFTEQDIADVAAYITQVIEGGG